MTGRQPAVADPPDLPDLPEILHFGPGRLTAGLDEMPRVHIGACHALFGEMHRREADELIALAEQVDLRGRGGAAFPVARKLAAVLASAAERHKDPVVLVNGAEGEPGSAKDKLLLLRTPYLVLGGAMLAAWALEARSIVVAVSSEQIAESVTAAAAAEPTLRQFVRVVRVPDRFVTGEAGALVNAVNGKAARPPGRKVLASDSGVDGLPTYLSNAETFAQLAILALQGPDWYAAAGTAAEPGTLLLTVGGAAARPAVVEVPAGLPLGAVLQACQAVPGDGVLVGGYHGAWLTAEDAWDVPVSRNGLAAAGGTLGAGVVLPLGRDTCALGEAARVATYLAAESSGQCGPCKLGLPGIARSLMSLASGSGGAEALDAVRRAAAAVRGRGACGHPDGVFRFVTSALDVFSGDIATHLFRGGCGRPVRGVLPLPTAASEPRLQVDWTRCRGHGLCAHIVPELMQLDAHGYPVLLDMPVPRWLERDARQATNMCPALALRLGPAQAPADRTPEARPLPADYWPAADRAAARRPELDGRSPRRPGMHRSRPSTGPQPILSDHTFHAPGVTEEWIAGLSDAADLIPGR